MARYDINGYHFQTVKLAASDVAATVTSSWILADITFRWILSATTSSRPSRPEFQHSPHLLARDIGRRCRGHLQLEGKPHHGECLHG
jgi:hypothetical protein